MDCMLDTGYHTLCPFYAQLSIQLYILDEGWIYGFRGVCLINYLSHFTSPQNARFMQNCPNILDEGWIHGLRKVCLTYYLPHFTSS